MFNNNWLGQRKTKTLVERMRSISVFELRPQHVLKRHFAFEDMPCQSGGYWFRRKYDPLEDDFYIEMMHRGPNNNQSTINFVETKCNYGGTRWWFECPGCQRRAAKLYDDRDNFYCRTCLDLEYSSHRTNYRSMFEPTKRRIAKLEKIAEDWKPQYSFYRGRLTKKARQQEKLLARAEMGTMFFQAQLKHRYGRPRSPSHLG